MFSRELFERLDLNHLLRSERGYLQLPSYGNRMGQSQGALIYAGTSSGIWLPSVTGDFVAFTTPGTWTFRVTTPLALSVKACGCGGYGARTIDVPNNYLSPGGGGGGGAYHLAFSYTFQPGVVYTFTLGTQSSTAHAAQGSATTLAIDGGATLLQLNAGVNGGTNGGTPFTGGPGGTSPTGGGSTGGDGSTYPGGSPGATSGTGGGGKGGGGNIGGTGGTAGQTGANGESAGLAGEAPGSYEGGDGGPGGGLIIDGTPGFGRGAGGSGEDDSDWDGGSIKAATNVYLAGNAAMQFTF